MYGEPIVGPIKKEGTRAKMPVFESQLYPPLAV